MSRVIAFANNQLLVAAAGTPIVMVTDPVAMNDDDRVTPHFNVEYINGVAAPGAQYLGQVSMNGTDWTDTTITDAATGTGLRVLAPVVSPAAFLRFKLFLTAGAGTEIASIDLHVLLDHA